MDYYTSEELYHYGVKGMKWGVRRDVELLANRRRNTAVRQARKDYRSGNITATEKKMAIKSAKADRKNFLKDTKKEYESLKTKSEKENASKNISKQAMKEVPNRTLKKGMRLANDILTGVRLGSLGYGTAKSLAILPAITAGTAISAGGLGALILADAAVTAAVEVGARQVRKMIGASVA